MKYLRTYWRLGIIAIAFAAVAGVATALYSTLTQAKETVPGIQEVELKQNEASPSVVFVKVGDSVQFNSRDGKDHYIGSGRGEETPHQDEAARVEKAGVHEHTKGLNSGRFGPDEGYLVRFSQRGTYEFHDHLNPNIRITVVAYQPD